MIAIKIEFFASQVSFGPLKLKFLWFFSSYLYTELWDIEVLKSRFRSKCWYLPLKFAPEAVGDEIGLGFPESI